MRIILSRHGQTLHNVGNLCSGQSDIDLTEVGVKQAHALGVALRKYGVTKLFCSDLKRAVQTAEIAAGYLNCTPTQRKELRERSFGCFEGKAGDALRADIASRNISPEAYRPEGGENFYDIIERLSPFLDFLRSEVSDEVVGIIAHGNLNSALLAHWQGCSPCAVKQDTACLNIIDNVFSNAVEFTRMNSIEHLTENQS